MKKQILSILLALCMVIGLLPMVALASNFDSIQRFDDTTSTDYNGAQVLEYMENQTAIVPDNVVTPYGTSSDPVTLVQKEELYLYSSVNNTVIYNKNAREEQQSAVSPRISSYNLQFTKSVAFDPTGCGKRNHIAVLGFEQINSNNDDGLARLVIINADTNTVVKNFELDKNWFKWKGDLTTAVANNFFAITAGDYNGDGRDSLVIYCTTFRGNPATSALKEVSYDGKNWNGPTLINVMKSESDYYFNKQYMNANLQSSYYHGHKLNVALASGDVDGDGIDDLVVVSCTGQIYKDNLTSDNYKASRPELRIGYGKKGTKNIGELSTTGQILGDDHTMAAPDVSIGDIDGDGKNEIIAAGFHSYNTSSNSAKLLEGEVYYTVCDGDGNIVINATTNDVSALNKGRNVYPEDSVWPQFSVECVNFDGAGSKAYVFINGYIYEWAYSSGRYRLVRASGSNSLDQSSNQNDGNFAFNFHITKCTGFQGTDDISWEFIRSAAVGNFYGSNSGKQGLSLIVGFKVKGKTEYYHKKIDIYKDDSGNWVQKGGDSAYLYFNTKSSDIYSGHFLCPVDIGNDTVIVRYNSTKAVYTDPNVVAFLQAAPYFSELGAGKSSTTYSYSESYTKSTLSGKEISTGIGISAEFETPALKTSVETSLSESISENFKNSLTTEYTTTFEANNKNQVIVRRTLLHLHCYDLLTGYDTNGNPVFEESGVVVTVPQHPVLSSMSMEQYDDFAKAYNEKYGKGADGAADYYLDLISKNNGALKKKYYLNNEGNPFAYAANSSKYKNGFNMSASNVWMELSHSGGTSQLAYSTSVGSEYTKTKTEGVSVNLAVSVGSSFMGFGMSVGVTMSLEALRSSGVSTAQLTTTATGGSVQNLTDNEESYKFNWQLIGWKTEAGDGLFQDVPFVGYAVKDVSAPTPCVNDLHVTYTDTPGEAYLHWSKPASPEGRIPPVYYYIYEINTKGERIYKGNTTETQQLVTSNASSASYIVVAYDQSKIIANRSISSNEVLVVFSPTATQVRKLIEQAGGDIDTSIEALKQTLETGQADAIAEAIADLTAAYKAADELLKSEVGNDMAALEAKLTAADEALQTAFDQVLRDLDEMIRNLNGLIEAGDDVNAKALQKAIFDLTAAYQAADELLKSELKGDLSDLKQKMQAAIDAVQNSLDKAVENLTKKLEDSDAANAKALQEAITDLTAAYRAADEILKSEFSGDMTGLKERMNAADEALQGAINEVQANLDRAIENLTEQMQAGDNANADALKNAIIELTDAYQAANDLLQAEINDLSDKLTALEAQLLKAEETLHEAINTVQKNLDKAVEDLTKAREDGDAATIARMNAEIDSLTKAYKTADEFLDAKIKQLEISAKSADDLINSNIKSLENSVTEADGVLQGNIDALEKEIAALRSELEAFKAQVAAQDTENAKTVQTMAGVNDTQQSELSTLKTVATVGLCISIASALGNVALLVLYLRKKSRLLPGIK